MQHRLVLGDYRFSDLIVSALGHGMVLAVLVFLAAVFHFVPWHFFEDIAARSGDGPSTVVDFTILATILALPGLWLTVQSWLSVWDDGNAATACFLGFGLLLLTDAATAASWSMGHPITRYQAFGVAYVLMAFSITLAYWRGCCEDLPAPKPHSPPSALEVLHTVQDIQAIGQRFQTTQPAPPPRAPSRPRPGPPRCRIRPPRYCSDHDD